MTRFYTVLSSILISFFVISSVSAATPLASIELSASKTQITQGDSFSVSVSIKKKGDSNINIGNVNIPGIDAFEIHGTSSSTQILAIWNENAIETTSIYSAVAKKSWTFIIGPVIFQDGKQQLTSNSLSIIVSANTNQKIDEPQDTSNPNPETSDWSLKDWLKIGWISLSIFIVILFVFILRYEKSKIITKNNPIPLNLEENINFSTKESIIQIIRENLRTRYQKDTTSLTYSELFSLEQNPEKKIILKKILSEIESQEYWNKSIDIDSLRSIILDFIKENKV